MNRDCRPSVAPLSALTSPKANEWMLRAAGDVDRPRLLKFLDQYAATMPRTLLRYSIEKLDKEQRTHYMNMKKNA